MILSSWLVTSPASQTLRFAALAVAPLCSSSAMPFSNSWTVTTDRNSLPSASVLSSQSINACDGSLREGASIEMTLVSRR
jgi:hypothetical protein